MDIQQALETLELKEGAAQEEVTSAKRRLLNALHPDRHPQEQGSIFTRLTQDILAAADLLENNLGGTKKTRRRRKGGDDADSIVTTLFEDDEASQAFKDMAASRGSIVPYSQSFATDGKLAVGVRGIDYGFLWNTTSPHGDIKDHSGTALYLIVKNRTKSPISDFFLGLMSYLIDNQDNQYAPTDTLFYWCEDEGSFNLHSDFMAPHSQIDGFIIFPSLRSTSKKFSRYVINGGFQIGSTIEGYKQRYYDVKLV